MKKILIDGTTISRQMDGLTQYVVNVVSRLDTSWAQFTLWIRPNECDPTYRTLFEQKGIIVEEVAISPIGPKRDWQFRRYLKQHTPFDAAWIPSNQYPLFLHLPSVYTVHDIIYERFPEQLGNHCD